jgi:hypothetical protein
MEWRRHIAKRFIELFALPVIQDKAVALHATKALGGEEI